MLSFNPKLRIKVEEALDYPNFEQYCDPLGDGLVLGVIVLLEVGVGQGVFYLDA